MHVMSIKFSRTPRLHSRLLFLQFKQSGVPSSHLRCLSLQVRQPVRTRLLLAGVFVDDGIFMSDAGRRPFDLGEFLDSGTAARAALDSFRRFGGLTLERSYAVLILMAYGKGDCSA